METTQSAIGLFEDPESRKKTQRHRYILFQMAGWGTLFSVAITQFLQQLPNLGPTAYPRVHPVEFAFSLFYPTAVGFLLTHCTRPFLSRWGWKNLSWQSLMPRIFATGLVLSFFWLTINATIGNLLPYGAATRPARAVSYYLIPLLGNSIYLDGWLVAYFLYHLFDRLNRIEKERLSLVASQKEAELSALKSQVNPHFIFNSLNSLRSLIEDNPARARLAVTQLANLLRYSLQSGQTETVLLEEELRLANDYLALEQVRYEERLSLRINVASEALALPVPPMLLQTLVENAVKYGIAQRHEGGEISIVAHCDGEGLYLRVANPSAPANSSKISFESTGVGLRNAATRLRLLFGERATLRLHTNDPGLVVAEVFIPLIPMPVRLP